MEVLTKRSSLFGVKATHKPSGLVVGPCSMRPEATELVERLEIVAGRPAMRLGSIGFIPRVAKHLKARKCTWLYVGLKARLYVGCRASHGDVGLVRPDLHLFGPLATLRQW